MPNTPTYFYGPYRDVYAAHGGTPDPANIVDHAQSLPLANAAGLAEQNWRGLAREPQYQHWPSQPPAVYGFGHSLGGLLSLSLPALPALIGPDAASPWEPQVILACDPATSTEMGIPGFAIALLKLFGSPFTAEPLRIQGTGACLRQPVAILHGLADTLVPPQQWDPQGSYGAYAAIHSHEKALFFASSNPQYNPPLLAFHNQAVTSTKYYDDDLFRYFGGVKHGANAYNTASLRCGRRAATNAAPAVAMVAGLSADGGGGVGVVAGSMAGGGGVFQDAYDSGLDQANQAIRVLLQQQPGSFAATATRWPYPGFRPRTRSV